jgi:hypothetical protein
MPYTIRQTYINHQTGERREIQIKNTWQTERGAQRAADRLSWSFCPDGKTIISESNAEVIPA